MSNTLHVWFASWMVCNKKNRGQSWLRFLHNSSNDTRRASARRIAVETLQSPRRSISSIVRTGTLLRRESAGPLWLTNGAKVHGYFSFPISLRTIRSSNAEALHRIRRRFQSWLWHNVEMVRFTAKISVKKILVFIRWQMWYTNSRRSLVAPPGLSC